MTNGKLFILKIYLNNFMAHQSTSIDIEKPILLISGANGSGKSQILEAIQLGFGELSSRARKLGIGSLIHPDANPKKAIIEITVSNPKHNGNRILDIEIPALKPILENPTITFRTTIQSQKVSRAIGNGKLFREIRQRDLRRMLKPLGIRPTNQLTFTIAETVEVFSQESPYKKFQVLLENLGQLDLKEQIVMNEQLLQESYKETTRLQQKLQTEKSNLELFKSMFEYIQQRSKLEAKLEEIVLERKWVDVYHNEDKKEKLDHDLNINKEAEEKITKEINQNNKKIKDNGSLKEKTSFKVENLKLEIKNTDKAREEDKDKRSTLKGRITELKSLLGEKKKTHEEMSYVIKNKDNVKEFQIQLSDLDKNLSSNKENMEKLNLDLQNLDEEQKKEDEKISKYEQEIIEQAIILKQKLELEGLSSQVMGPIIEKIRIKEDQNQWEEAIKPLIGDYLFSFVALNPEVFNKTKKLYDSLFVSNKPAFHVFLFSDKERRKNQLDKRIYSYTPDLLEGSPEIILTLKNVMNSGVAEIKSASELAKAAQEFRISVLTKDAQNFFTPAGSFTRPPKPIKSTLGVELQEPKKPKEIRVQRKNIQSEIAQLQRDQHILVKTKGELRSKINLFSSNDQQLFSKKIELEDDITEINSQIKKLQENEISLSSNVDNSEKQIKDFRKEINQKEDSINELGSEIKVLENELKNLGKKKEEIDSKLKELTKTINPLMENITNTTKELISYGLRPEERREKEIVDSELTEVKTKLAMIKNKSIGIDKLEHQEKLVIELQETFEERRNHLENLREDIKKRKDDWEKIIKPFFILLNEKLQELSRDIFYQTRVFINPEDLDKAGLVLQAVTKEEWRNDTALSSGEKVMLMECLILALHGLSNSPIHAIDEFTQRLDMKNKNKVFKIVEKLMNTLSEEKNEPTQFILITQDAFGIDIGDIQHIVFAQAKLLSNSVK